MKGGMLVLKIMSKHSATLVIMFLITLLPIFQYQASAHATLEKSTPQQQGVIKDKPEAIKLEFNEPVNTKYSSVTLFDDKGKKIKDLKPITTGWSQTVVFSSEQIVNGTNTIEWHTVSADGHEVGDTFEFSVGKVTAKDVDISSPFYEQSKFWFGLLRYVTEGANFLLIGLFWLNGIARKRGLRQFNVLPKQSGIAWIMAMSVLVSLVVYMMTLTSDILEDILSFKLEVIMQFPYILSSISLIILFILFILKDMEKIWYWLISIIMIAVISMSGHVWSQQVPLWSIIIRTIHLIGLTLWLGSLVYLICYAIKVKIDQLTSVRRMLLKVNIIAVIMLVFTGILMAIDETNILTLRNNVSAWSIYLVIKIAGTITMMLLGFYQTMHALRQRQQVHRFALMTELLIGMILIFAGIMMSK